MRVFFVVLFLWTLIIVSIDSNKNALQMRLARRRNLIKNHEDAAEWSEEDLAKTDLRKRREVMQAFPRKRKLSKQVKELRNERGAVPGIRGTILVNGVPLKLSNSSNNLQMGGVGMVALPGNADTISSNLVAQDNTGNVAAGVAELEMPAKGASGPIYELVGAGVKMARPTPPPPPPAAVGEVMVNIERTPAVKPKKPRRHWCELAGVWINDEGSLLLTLGFPSSDKTLLSGYMSQVSVDMTPTVENNDHRRRRRRRAAESRTSHEAASEPRYPPPPPGTSGIPSSLTNKTALQGSAVTRAGPFAVVSRHSGSSVGSMIGQCQMCGGVDTIVAQYFALSEVFTCIDAMWSSKGVRFMFHKWGDHHERRHWPRQQLETQVLIKQRDRGRARPPPPSLPVERTIALSEDVVENIRRR